MAGDGTQPQPGVQERSADDRLDSWKEIATYLKKEVRTVQRWEKNLALPVHRLAAGKLGTVFAYRSELDSWWLESQTRREVEPKADQETDSSELKIEVGDLPSNTVPFFSGDDEKQSYENPVNPNLEQTANHIRRIMVIGVLAVVGLAALLAVFWPWISDAMWPPATKVILAVRPFRNLSGDPGQDFIADGMTEEMITHLGQLHPNEMGVVRLSPAYATVALGRIAKEVGANYVLEGGVRRSAQQIAITAQLIQVSDQTQVWGESYERDLADLLRVQIEVALAITREVVNKLPHAQPKTPQVEGSVEVARSTAGRIMNKWTLGHAQTRQVNGEAYLAYLEGRYFWSKRTEAGFGKAITAFQRSIEIDPTYAPPYAGLADCYELLGSAPYSTLRPSEAFPKAEAAARKALELDSTLAEAHVSLGYSQMVYEWNYPEARKEFEIALQLRPGYATGHQFYGYYLTAMGQLDAAIAERKKALDLDPISPLLHSALGEAYYHARHFDVTIAQNTRALELDPSYAIALVNIGRAYELMGMHQQARDAFQKILSLVPEDPAILALLAHEYAVSGDKANADKLLDKLTAISRGKYVPAVYFAVIYIGLHRKDDAFRWLDKAYQERCEYLVYLGSEPLADPLRDDPRFASLLARLGLQPAHIATAQ